LRLVDDFIGGLLDELDPAVTLLVVSDHGNLEDASTGTRGILRLGSSLVPIIEC
jgi:arylsulfatase A-like enzyme